MHSILISRHWPKAAIALAVLASAASSFAPWPVFGHSAGLDMIRLFELDRGVRGGDFYPRWAPDVYFGYGSPLLALYAPLAYFIAEIFRRLGAVLTLAMKLSYLVAVLLAAFGMSALAGHEHRRIAPDTDARLSDGVGVVAAILYVFAPYFLVNFYARSAAAELYGFALIPWVLFFVGQYRDSGNIRSLSGAAVAYGFLNISHNISALIYAPMVFAFVLLTFTRKRMIAGLGALAVGLSIGAFFWFPALALKNAVQSEVHLTTGYFSFMRHFIPPSELFIPRWGYQPPESAIDAMSRQVGIVHWAVVAIAAWSFIKRRETRRALGPYLLFFIAGLFFTNSLSASLWKSVPLLKFVQFPWRFLMVATFAATALFPAAFEEVRSFAKKRQSLILAAFAASIFAAYGSYARARYVFLDLRTMGYREATAEEAPGLADDATFATFDEFITTPNLRRSGVMGMASDDFLPVDVKHKPTRPAERPFVVVQGVGDVQGREDGFNRFVADVRAATEMELGVEVFFFPGWKARIDGMPVEVRSRDKTGTAVLRVPPGNHRVEVFYGDAPIQRAADILTLLGWLAAAGLFIAPLRNRSPAS